MATEKKPKKFFKKNVNYKWETIVYSGLGGVFKQEIPGWFKYVRPLKKIEKRALGRGSMWFIPDRLLNSGSSVTDLGGATVKVGGTNEQG